MRGRWGRGAAELSPRSGGGERATCVSHYSTVETSGSQPGWTGALAWVNASGNIAWSAGGSGKVGEEIPTSAKIVSLAAGESSIVALDSAGDAWAWGASWLSAGRFRKLGSGYTAMANWTRRYKGVATNGALFLGTDGKVSQSLANGLFGGHSTPTRVKGLEGVTVTRLFADDGIYQVLASDGTVWSWTGNADWPTGIGTAAPVPGLVGVTDFVASGMHLGEGSTVDDYAGWGLALSQAGCALV